MYIICIFVGVGWSVFCVLLSWINVWLCVRALCDGAGRGAGLPCLAERMRWPGHSCVTLPAVRSCTDAQHPMHRFVVALSVYVCACAKALIALCFSVSGQQKTTSAQISIIVPRNDEWQLMEINSISHALQSKLECIF